MTVEVVETTRAEGGERRVRARSWADPTDGSMPARILLLEEVRIGTDHWVHLAALEREGITEPAWIHIDATDPDQRRWMEANPVGLIEQAELWSARAGDPTGDDEVVSVDRRSATERVLRLASGLRMQLTREDLYRATVDPPTSLPVVPLREMERVVSG